MLTKDKHFYYLNPVFAFWEIVFNQQMHTYTHFGPHTFPNAAEPPPAIAVVTFYDFISTSIRSPTYLSD